MPGSLMAFRVEVCLVMIRSRSVSEQFYVNIELEIAEQCQQLPQYQEGG